MASVLLVHGAASGPWVFDGWEREFPARQVHAVDLQAGLVVAEASMQNYAAAVSGAAELLGRPLALVGWSMGGLAAMIAAARTRPAALVLLEPSAPAEVQGMHPEVELRPGTFDGEAEYGGFPAGMRARPESVLARAERKRGISVPVLPHRSLVVYGREFAGERGRRVADAYGVESVEVAAASHWDLVRGPEARAVVARFLDSGA